MRIRIVAAGTLAVAAAAGAQTSPAFLTGGYCDGPLYRVQGGVVTHSALTPNINGCGWTPAMAVLGGAVQVAGYGQGGIWPEYSSADLSQTGNNINANGIGTYGGTSDGKKIYYYNNNTGQIYQADPGWTNPTFLCNSPYGFMYDLGYDAATDTLWGSSSGVMYNFAKNGTPLGSFGVNNGSGTGIGVDNADGTIWMTNYCSFPPTLVQYAKNGSFLGQLQLNPNIVRQCGDWWIEFEVHAPGAAALLGLGGVLAGRRRR